LIKRSYISRVDQNTFQKMVVRGETVDGDRAVVRTILPLDRGREMPLDYSLHKMDDRWQVYDVSIEGIGLVALYRAQFNRIIRTASYEVLMAKLRSNQAELSTPVAPSGGKAAQ
jgi:phospholipid transport system substrate-binding protein